jgi:hypothetical protein
MLLLFLFVGHFDVSAATRAVNGGVVGRDAVADSREDDSNDRRGHARRFWYVV